MSPEFKSAFEVVMSHEGGYVNDPKDPGGETKFGISKSAYPKLNIKDLTRDHAREIYYEDYWKKVRGDLLPFGVALSLFDMAVNMGVKRTIKALQGIASVKQDGVFGDNTLMAALALTKYHIMEQLAIYRIAHYTSLPTWDRFGKGWTIRTVEVLSTGLLMRG